MQTTIKATTVGSAGSATATVTGDRVRGRVHAIKVDWHASAPATSDIVITEASGLGRTIYTKANSVTDVTFYPYVQGGDNTGAAITGVYTPVYLDGVALSIAVTGCDALTDAVVVTVILYDQFMGA